MVASMTRSLSGSVKYFELNPSFQWPERLLWLVVAVVVVVVVVVVVTNTF